MLSTTDAIKIQLQNLINCHEYKVQFFLHNPSSLQAYLDKTEITFTASGDKQNVFVLLTKSSELPIIIIEVITTDLTDDTTGSSSMFIQCPDYTGCEDSGYFLPLSLDIIP